MIINNRNNGVNDNSNNSNNNYNQINTNNSNYKNNNNNTINTNNTNNSDPNTELFIPLAKSPIQTLLELTHSPTFWRFSAFTLILINLKAVFRHLDATLPTYLVRTFGDDVPKGIIYSINPFIIIFLTPLVSALTTNYAHYDMIKWGSYLTAFSPFFPAFSSSIWASVW